MDMTRPQGEHIKPQQIEFLDVLDQEDRILNEQDPYLSRVYNAVEHFSNKNLTCNSTMVIAYTKLGKTAVKVHLKTLFRDGLLARRYAKVVQGTTVIMPLYVIKEKADLLRNKDEK